MTRRRVEITSRRRALLNRVGEVTDGARRRLHGSPLARRILRRRVLGAAMVIASTTVVHHVVTEAEAVRRTWGSTRTVVVTAGPIAGGQLLGAGNTVLERRPDRFVPDGALSDLPVGRRAGHDLVRSEVVTGSALGSGGAGEVASQLAEDTVGITVSTGDLRPPVARGDVVDVYSRPEDLPVTDPGEPLTEPRRVATSATVIEVDRDQVTVAVATDDAADVSAASITGPVALVLVHPR